VQRLRQRGPEVPVVLGTPQISAGIALDGLVEVGELKRVARQRPFRRPL
jgi:hypothetical protein